MSWYEASLRALALPALLLLSNCWSAPTTSPRLGDRMAELRVTANVQSSTVAAVVVRVTAADIQPTLVFNLSLEAGTASGALDVPAGAARTFTITAFDAGGLETHRGQKTIDVAAGSNPGFSITLVPIPGQQPIVAQLGTVTVTVTNPPTALEQGETVQLTAQVSGPDGPIDVEPGTIRWATATPATLLVDPMTGVAKGKGWGEARVIATYAGVAGIATITVNPVVLAAGDIAECNPPWDEHTALLLDTLAGEILALGDLAYEDGTIEEFNQCYGPTWGRHKARTHPAPGNHEYHAHPTGGPAGPAGYFAYFGAAAGDSGKGWYAFNAGSWRIYSLNSEFAYKTGNEQVVWLAADLAKPENQRQCVLAYWHNPRFSSGARHGSSTRTEPFWNALYAAGADVILVAHEHHYERFGPQNTAGVADPVRGIRQFVVGTGGSDPLSLFAATPVANSEVRLNSHFGVIRLVLEPGSYRWRFISTDGAVRDSGTDICR